MIEFTNREFKDYVDELKADQLFLKRRVLELFGRVQALEKQLDYHIKVVGNPHEI